MERYIVFFGDLYSLGGGSKEIIGHCNSIDEGKEMIEKKWREIWNSDWCKHLSLDALKERDRRDTLEEIYDCQMKMVAWRFS